MFYSLTGSLIKRGLNYAVVECGGVGFRCFTSNYTLSAIADEKTVTLFTYLNVREDALDLFGFSDEYELDWFKLLISVNGVGPKAGLAIMSLGTTMQVKKLIGMRDAAGIAKAQGVGKKTAERIILELSEKVGAFEIEAEAGGDDKQVAARPVTGERTEAVMALTALGYTKKEAEDAIGQVADEGISAEEYIKKALRFLM